MRVVPERAGVRRRELVGEALARPDRRLGEAGNAIHGDGKPDAVPVNGGVFCKPVLYGDTDGLALQDAYLRARDTAVVAPDIGTTRRLADDRQSRPRRDELEFPGRRRRTAHDRRQQCRGRHTCASHEKVAAIDSRSNTSEHLQPSRSWNEGATRLEAAIASRRHARAPRRAPRTRARTSSPKGDASQLKMMGLGG